MRTIYAKIEVNWEDYEEVSDELLFCDVVENTKFIEGVSMELSDELTRLRAELEEAKKKQADDAKWLGRAGRLITLHMKERDEAFAENARLQGKLKVSEDNYLALQESYNRQYDMRKKFQGIIDGAEWGTKDETDVVDLWDSEKTAKEAAVRYHAKVVRIIKADNIKTETT